MSLVNIIIFASIAVLFIVFLLIRTKFDKTVESEIEPMDEDYVFSAQPEVIEPVEPVVLTETVDEMEKRLSEIKSEDVNKPFAKMSSSTLSEAEAPVEKPVKKRKKRPSKKVVKPAEDGVLTEKPVSEKPKIIKKKKDENTEK